MLRFLVMTMLPSELDGPAREMACAHFLRKIANGQMTVAGVYAWLAFAFMFPAVRVENLVCSIANLHEVNSLKNKIESH